MEIRENNDGEYLKDLMYESVHITKNKPKKEKLLSDPMLKKYYENWGKQGDTFLGIFEEDGTFVGGAYYRLFENEDKGYGFVNNATPEITIALFENYRGKGYGQKLLSKLIDKAKEQGFKQISLSVDSQHYPAIKLYEKNGFVFYKKDGTSQTMICKF